MKLTRCKICKEELRSEESVRAGIGPVCAANLTKFLAAVGSSAEEIATLALVDDNISRLLRCAERAAGLGNPREAKLFIERARNCAQAYHQAYHEDETAEVKAA